MTKEEERAVLVKAECEADKAYNEDRRACDEARKAWVKTGEALKEFDKEATK